MPRGPDRGAASARDAALAALALALCGLGGCEGASPWLGFSRAETALAIAFDNERAIAICERNMREVAGPQALSPGQAAPSRDTYGVFVMAVSFWETAGLLRTEHHCLVDPATYAVTEWRTPMVGGGRVL